MRSDYKKQVLVISMIALIFGGCVKQPMSTSLTKLGSVSKASYGHRGIPVMQSISINGLGSGDDIGTITYDPDRDSWRKCFDWFSEFPDMMAPRLTLGDSYVLHSWSEMSSPITNVTQIKKSLLDYQRQLTEYYRIELKHNVLQQIVSKANSENNTSNSIKALVRANYVASDSNSSINDTLKELQNRANELQKELNTSVASFNTAGVLISRWETSNNHESTLNAADSALDTSTEKEKKLQGFVILGEPHIWTLYFGQDYNVSTPKKLASDINHDHFYITHYQLRAKYIAYAESSYQSLAIALDADVSKLVQELSGINGISKMDIQNFADELKIKLSSAYGRIASNTVEGVLLANHSEKVYLHNQNNPNCVFKTLDFNSTLPIISSRISLKFFEEGK